VTLEEWHCLGVALSWCGGVVSVLPPTWPGVVVVCSLLHGLAYHRPVGGLD
jgi:hypothetical protein